MYKNCITDVSGILVGQASDHEALTGCTVILCGEGAVCGVEVRGSAPGTRETDLLEPHMLVDQVHGVFLAGGSAFGLAAGDGMMRYLEEHGIGFDVGVTKVPIVTGAVLFDLNIGSHRIRPDASMGYEACRQASQEKIKEGNIGAGTGATVGKILGHEQSMKGGIGSASIALDNGLVVGAIVAVNALGDIRDHHTGKIIAGAREKDTGALIDTCAYLKQHAHTSLAFKRDNTTIGTIATNARLTKAECKKLAQMAMNGLVKVISPFGSTLDGDTVFALSKGEYTADLNLLGIMAAEAMALAVNRAIKEAESVGSIPSSGDYLR
ncbi:L-aminopeptidase/D-esterase-like protein [Anaerosolibacter carboniphilus]|uniref:L-aminopeptidase/D-esterase-like protein n=1 Tax=Anaerosolibacter carboniphilus TaxID=1417629 RepID=A0A841L300_9FIRM|nr:P1 family peptidase [Anaerosolibacter carboniphilus]MBB6219008.1 L-aminopeptidase/D-esterase-like protein [Anaerosolibacter carboniphilus]